MALCFWLCKIPRIIFIVQGSYKINWIKINKLEFKGPLGKHLFMQMCCLLLNYVVFGTISSKLDEGHWTFFLKSDISPLVLKPALDYPFTDSSTGICTRNFWPSCVLKRITTLKTFQTFSMFGLRFNLIMFWFETIQ